MKKFLCVALAVMMLVAVAAVASADNTATVTVATVEGTPGKNVTVEVTAENLSIAGYVICVDYDRTAMTLLSAIPGDYYIPYTDEAYLFEKDGEHGIDAIMFAVKQNKEINGILFTLTFAVSEDAAIGSEIPVDLIVKDTSDVDNNTVDFTVVAGAVVIPCDHATTEVIPGYAATCTATGLTDGVKCSICGEILVAQEEIPALGHTPVVDPAVEPTCTETGLTEGSHCSVCGEVLVAQEVVDALGHDLHWEYDHDNHWQVCSRCGEEFKAEPHELEEATKEADCGNDGYTTYYCRICGYTHTGDIVPATGNHTWGDWEVVTDATCTTEGSKVRYCSVCGDSDVEKIEKLPHTPVVDEAVAPTCTETGLTEGSHCSVCGEIIVPQDVIPALGHTWGEEWHADDSSHWHICTVCGAESDKGNHHGEKIREDRIDENTVVDVYLCDECGHEYYGNPRTGDSILIAVVGALAATAAAAYITMKRK